ncbi:MAG: arginine deiminase family protein, partial [Nitrospiraceae bacterium]|nr:arginine deiminase family protein [Nitrospiraceae bacterium]
MVDSEYGRLASVLLYGPGPEIDRYGNPGEVLHLGPIDHAGISEECGALRRTYEENGVSVVQVDPSPVGEDRRYLYNLMYCRDLFFMTPDGAVLSRMAHPVRREEVRYAERTLRKQGIPIRCAVWGEGTFEGADALWVGERLVAVGVGNRTNREGFEQVRAELGRTGVACVALPARQTLTQHLLGTIQIVDRDLAFVRRQIVDEEAVRFLAGRGFRLVDVPENDEVRKRQAMNIVVTAPRTILMSAGCPETREIFLDAGVAVAAEVGIDQLTRGGGGLACA